MRRLWICATAALVLVASAVAQASSTGAVVARHGVALVPATCHASACTVSIRLHVTTRTAHGRLQQIVVGTRTLKLAAGPERRVRVRLSALGRRLERARGGALRVRFAVAVVPATPTPSPTPTPVPPPPCRPTGPPQLPADGAGQTAILGGIYVFGGPIQIHCQGPVGPTQPSAGTVQVLDGGGNVVATQAVAAGQTFSIPVAPGTYTLRAALGSSSEFDCRALRPVTVADGQQVSVAVDCVVP